MRLDLQVEHITAGHQTPFIQGLMAVAMADVEGPDITRQRVGGMPVKPV